MKKQRLSPSRQKRGKSGSDGSRGGFPEIRKMGASRWTLKEEAELVHTQSVSQTFQLYSSMCHVCPVSPLFLPALIISLPDNQVPLLLVPQTGFHRATKLSFENINHKSLYDLAVPTRPMSSHFISATLLSSCSFGTPSSLPHHDLCTCWSHCLELPAPTHRCLLLGLFTLEKSFWNPLI